MNYKVKVGSEAESKEAQELFFELGYKWFSGGKKAQHLEQSCSSSFGYLVAWSSGCFANVIQCGCGDEDAKEITIPQLKDMVVLNRNSVGDATHTDGHYSFYVGKDKNYFFSSCDKAWLGTWRNVDILKPIEKPMKEYLDPENGYKLNLTDRPFFDWIEIPEGADTLAGDGSTRYFWKHGVGEKGNMTIGVGESLARYSGWTDCEESADVWLDRVNDDSFKIIWQRETLNDKVASAEVARQSGMFVGTPFSDLPEFNFGAIDDSVESNVEQGAKHSHYKKDISHLNALDIYRVTELFNPHSCGAHIAKKALCSGQRGHKDLLTDIQDIIDTAERWKEMFIEDEKAK